MSAEKKQQNKKHATAEGLPAFAPLINVDVGLGRTQQTRGRLVPLILGLTIIFGILQCWISEPGMFTLRAFGRGPQPIMKEHSSEWSSTIIKDIDITGTGTHMVDLPNHLTHKRKFMTRKEHGLAHRGAGATLTYFYPGLGACGGHNGNNDYIVAISHLIWDGGSHCNKPITITYHGKTFQATVVDKCMSCDPNHIDLSPGLLSNIVGAGTDMVTDASWSFGGGGAPPKNNDDNDDKPTTKPKPKPTSTSTTERPRSTSTSTTKEQLTSTSTTETSASPTKTSTRASSSTSTTIAAIPTNTNSTENIQNINNFLINIGGLAVAALKVVD